MSDNDKKNVNRPLRDKDVLYFMDKRLKILIEQKLLDKLN